MAVSVEDIKKMMGWCPNLGAMETRKAMQFDDIVVNASDRDNKLPQLTCGWLTKYRNRILLYSLIFTLLAIYFFISEGKNRLDLFTTGIISGLVLSLVTGVTEWHRLDKAAAGGFKKLHVTRNRMLANCLVIIGLIVIVIFISSYFTVKTGGNIRDIPAFSSGLILIIWTQFFEVVYWEWKNKKTLIVEKASFYAVDAEVEGSK